MIKKSVFEDELIEGMQKQLSKEPDKSDLIKAVDYITAAIEIFEDNGMTAKADQLLSVLEKFAAKKVPPKKKVAPKKSDPHTKGLTPEKMVQNLLHHGHPMNYADDNLAKDMSDKLLEQEIEASTSEIDLPEDYETCSLCGYDHEYEPEEANQWHLKHPTDFDDYEIEYPKELAKFHGIKRDEDFAKDDLTFEDEE